jgi:hypothetical protein
LARATAWGAQSLSHKLQCAAAGLAPSLEDAGRWIEAARVSGEAALQRLAHQQRARAWLVNGQQNKAAADARAALALAEAIDPWLDDTARRWVDAAEVLSACGCLEEAQAALDAGEHWLRQGAEGLSDPARREAWLRGHAAHRQLLVRPRA